jgi:hypothetical protein
VALIVGFLADQFRLLKGQPQQAKLTAMYVNQGLLMTRYFIAKMRIILIALFFLDKVGFYKEIQGSW